MDMDDSRLEDPRSARPFSTSGKPTFLHSARRALAMRWPNFWSSKGEKSEEEASAKSPGEVLDSLIDAAKPSNSSSTTSPPPKPLDLDWHSYFTPQSIVSTVILTSGCIGFYRFYRTFLRRIPAATNISPGFFRKRSVFGKVTSVGDGDNFRIFHTPGGMLAGWGWWRSIPADKKALRNNTIHIRLAGIDAPEAAHFGRPAQPYSQEALDWLTSYVLGRRIRAYVYKADQYQRVVATVYVRKGFLRRDVGLQMLRSGLATVYEAKSGVEFGEGLEAKYRKAEWWAKLKRKGMWAGKKKDFESPREYKTRHGSGTPIEEVPVADGKK